MADGKHEPLPEVLLIKLPSQQNEEMLRLGGPALVLGRNAAKHLGVCLDKISRSQFSLEYRASGTLYVTSLSTNNPTKVVLASPSKNKNTDSITGRLLNKGEEQQLQPGDSVYLLATSTDSAVQILPPSTTTQPANNDITMTEQQQQQQQQPLHPCMLLLAGLQGSGKSTFSINLLTQSKTANWVRINQDSIKNGAPGSREQCLTAAETALTTAGNSVIIDRTNIDSNQRSLFTALARRLNIPVHCCVLNLPSKVCGARAAQRAQHEGNLTGSRAYAVVGMSNKAFIEAGLPDKDKEGLSSVIVCENDGDIAAALHVWARYGSSTLSGNGNGGTSNNTAAAAMGNGNPTDIENSNSCSLNNIDEVIDSVEKLMTEYERLRPEQPKQEAVNTLDRYFGGGGDTVKGTGGTVKGTATIGTTSNKSTKAAATGTTNTAAVTTTTTTTAKRMKVEQQQEKAGGGGSSNAFQVLMTAAKDKATQQQQQQSQAAGGGSGGKKNIHTTATAASVDSRHTFPNTHFINALAVLAKDPQKHIHQYPGAQIHPNYIRINDCYPKARRHALVIATAPHLLGPLDLTAADIPLLRDMKTAAQQWVEDEQRKVKEKEEEVLERFKFGFHSVPSMKQLHLHVISQDYISDALKNKKHWNSFTTSFFLPLDDVIQILETSEDGRLHYDLEEKERLLKGALKCHRCGVGLSSMPQLKKHIHSCRVAL